MVYKESSGDARYRLNWGNTGRSLTEPEGVQGSVLAGQPASSGLTDVAAWSAEESQLIPRRIPRQSHGQDRINILNWRTLLLGVASWVIALTLIVGVAAVVSAVWS